MNEDLEWSLTNKWKFNNCLPIIEELGWFSTNEWRVGMVFYQWSNQSQITGDSLSPNSKNKLLAKGDNHRLNRGGDSKTESYR